MKKIMTMIFILILRVNMYPQAEMLEVEDAIVATITTDNEILNFSNAEIAKIIEESIELNPGTNGLNTIHTNSMVNLKINDSTLYSFIPSEGASCWKILKKGINQEELKHIESFEKNSFSYSESLVDSASVSIYLGIIDSILGESNNSNVDSNLVKKESGLVSDSNIIGKESTIRPGNKIIIIPPIERRKTEELSKELMGIFDSSELKKDGEDNLLSDSSSSRKMDEYILMDSSSVIRSRYAYPYDYQGSETIKINFMEILVVVIVIVLVIGAIVFGWRDYKKNRSYSYKAHLRKLRKEKKLEDKKNKEKHPQKE